MFRSTSFRIILFLLAILGLTVGGVVTFVLLFNWNLALPFINQRISETIGREFDIRGNLHVDFVRDSGAESGWRRFLPQPRITADDVQISNPTWSKVGPSMGSVERIALTLRPLPLFSKHVVLANLVLNEPSVSLERRVDGSTSWALKEGTPSTWDIDIQRIEFSGGNLRYLDDGIALDLRLKASSIEDSGGSAKSSSEDTSHLHQFGMQFTLGGSYHNAPVTGTGRAGRILVLESSTAIFPVQANAQIGVNSIQFDGTFTDPHSPSGIDLQLTLGGASMADLYPLTGILLPRTPPYTTHGRLVGRKDDHMWSWTFEHFTGKVGESDLAGTLQYLPRQPRALLRGTVISQQLQLKDMGPSIGVENKSTNAVHDNVAFQPEDRALPVQQFNTAKWGALDADVKFTGKRLVRTGNIPLQNIVAEIHMKNKVLSLTPLNFGVAGGDITSNISLDGRNTLIDAQIKAAARNIKISELFPSLSSMQKSLGEVNGDAALTGHGNSISAMLATSNGEFAATATEGSVSKYMLELAGLNVANAVFAKLFGDKQVHMNCLASDFGVKSGKADIRQFVLDTDDARIDISGDVNMANESLNLDIRPKTKGARVFSLRTPLYAKGTFEHPEIGPYKGPLILKVVAAAVLTTVSPVTAILPLVNLNKAPDADCVEALAASNHTRVAPKSEPVAAPAKRVDNSQIRKAREEK